MLTRKSDAIGASYALARSKFEKIVPTRSRIPFMWPGIFACVRLPDGRVGRVREQSGALVKVRVRRATSNTHQFVMCAPESLKRVPCPKSWMSPEGYQRYLRTTLRKMRERQCRGRADGAGDAAHA